MPRPRPAAEEPAPSPEGPQLGDSPRGSTGRDGTGRDRRAPARPRSPPPSAGHPARLRGVARRRRETRVLARPRGRARGSSRRGFLRGVGGGSALARRDAPPARPGFGQRPRPREGASEVSGRPRPVAPVGGEAWEGGGGRVRGRRGPQEAPRLTRASQLDLGSGAKADLGPPHPGAKGNDRWGPGDPTESYLSVGTRAGKAV